MEWGRGLKRGKGGVRDGVGKRFERREGRGEGKNGGEVGGERGWGGREREKLVGEGGIVFHLVKYS